MTKLWSRVGSIALPGSGLSDIFAEDSFLLSCRDNKLVVVGALKNGSSPPTTLWAGIYLIDNRGIPNLLTSATATPYAAFTVSGAYRASETRWALGLVIGTSAVADYGLGAICLDVDWSTSVPTLSWGTPLQVLAPAAGTGNTYFAPNLQAYAGRARITATDSTGGGPRGFELDITTDPPTLVSSGYVAASALPGQGATATIDGTYGGFRRPDYLYPWTGPPTVAITLPHAYTPRLRGVRLDDHRALYVGDPDQVVVDAGVIAHAATTPPELQPPLTSTYASVVQPAVAVDGSLTMMLCDGATTPQLVFSVALDPSTGLINAVEDVVFESVEDRQANWYAPVSGYWAGLQTGLLFIVALIPFVPGPGSIEPPLRLAQRNDGLAGVKHPRLLSSHGAPSSVQRSAAPRLGTNGRYR